MASNTSTDKTPSWIAYVGGLASIATIIGVIIAYFAYIHPSPQPPAPTPGPVQPGQTSTTGVWDVILNSVNHNTVYKGYSTNSGEHFLLVDASFENKSSTQQVLSGSLFDLEDNASNHYTEDQASDPNQSFVVDAGRSIETITAFVVPDNECSFTLSFIADKTTIVKTWNITSHFPGC